METVRIGYVGGQPKRINERVIDDQWVRYLGEHVELVKIQPLAFMRMFSGSFEQWQRRLPHSLAELAVQLTDLCRQHQIKVLYVNLPALVPYLLLARNHANLDLRLLIIAHSVASKFWLRQWIVIAPLLTDLDVLLATTESSRQALLSISRRYETVHRLPLCIDTRMEPLPISREDRNGRQLLAIGRIEDTKNIHLLLESFAEIVTEVPDARLTIAGEFTGESVEQTKEYKALLDILLLKHRLSEKVSFPGVIVGEEKQKLFGQAELLVNLSTDPGETFGFNLIEAKVSGLPVVCSGWDGFRELVSDGQDGLLVDCDWEGSVPQLNEKQFARCCIQLLKDEEMRSGMSHTSQARSQEYDYRIWMPKLVHILNEPAGHQAPLSDSVLDLSASTLNNLSGILNVENLRQLGWLDVPLLSILSVPCYDKLNDWMPKVKPVIGHFALGSNPIPAPYSKGGYSWS